jgi:hypothetical protein
MSILSYPNRGPWGKSSWRGNCSGHIVKDLLLQYKPAFFIDPMVGSGTSVEVAKEMNIEAKGLDLHSGFNILRDSIVSAAGKEADMVWSHPAYHDMIVYSGNVWGKAHPDDLSRCVDEEDFLCKMEIALLNMREATKSGGHYGILIGDMRKNGKYSSYQADLIARMPKSELASVIIKAQHNCYTTENKDYNLKHMRIMHEYIILWGKPRTISSCIGTLSEMAKQQAISLKTAWKSVVHHALLTLGGVASLSDMYDYIAKNATAKLANNEHWKEKVRQVLQMHFVPQERGVWALA